VLIPFLKKNHKIHFISFCGKMIFYLFLLIRTVAGTFILCKSPGRPISPHPVRSVFLPVDFGGDVKVAIYTWNLTLGLLVDHWYQVLFLGSIRFPEIFLFFLFLNSATSIFPKKFRYLRAPGLHIVDEASQPIKTQHQNIITYGVAPQLRKSCCVVVLFSLISLTSSHYFDTVARIAVAYHLKYSISVSGIQSDSQFRVVSAMFAAATHPFLWLVLSKKYVRTVQWDSDTKTKTKKRRDYICWRRFPISAER